MGLFSVCHQDTGDLFLAGGWGRVVCFIAKRS